jgi:phenylalanine-4-hydroxylase
MDGLILLRRAQAAGLTVQAVGTQLKISGPRQAEPIVKLLAEHKSEVLAAIASADASQRWRERYTALTFVWSNGRRRKWEKARRLAWSDLQNEWHALHGSRFPPWQCAGCQNPLSGLATLDLPDGNRVHFDNIECLISFGCHWRRIAQERLIAAGLKPPDPAEGAR